jgi:hypothetical protein
MSIQHIAFSAREGRRYSLVLGLGLADERKVSSVLGCSPIGSRQPVSQEARALGSPRGAGADPLALGGGKATQGCASTAATNRKGGGNFPRRSLAVTQRLLEHSSVRLTNDVYTNVDPVLWQAVDLLRAVDCL